LAIIAPLGLNKAYFIISTNIAAPLGLSKD
jgi:hypothetical protein